VLLAEDFGPRARRDRSSDLGRSVQGSNAAIGPKDRPGAKLGERCGLGSARVKFREYPPHAALADFVKCFWSLEHTYTSERPVEEVLPDACAELILNFGAPYRLLAADGSERAMPAAFLVGFQKEPVRFRCDGTVRLVAARLYPWGASAFAAQEDLGAGRPPPALGEDWRETLTSVEALVLAGEYAGAVERLEESLLRTLAIARFDTRQVQAAARILYREKGCIRISDLAERCFLSTRQLERQVRDATGVPPKTLARTIRFDAARERLMFAPDTDLTQLAFDCGYADQAHFIRDFRKFTKKTPGEFAGEMRALQSVLHDNENVVFLRPPDAR
jgi:AraC-like DNA-binding protein